MISCNSENEVFEPSCDEILCFESYQEYSDELEKVRKMNVSELEKWQELQGFKSLGVKSEKLYYNTDLSDFEDKEEFYNYVSNNEKYLQLIEDDLGEISFETTLCNYTERFFANNDQIFQVENDIYKVFENGIVRTDESNIYKIQSLNLLELCEDDCFEIIKNNDTPNLKSTSCGYGYTDTATDDKERIKFVISYSEDLKMEEDYAGISYPTELNFEISYTAKAQRKVMWVWWRADRTVNAEINAAIDYTDESGEMQREVIRTGTLIGTGYGILEGEKKISVPLDMGDDFSIEVEIFGLDCWATQGGCSNAAEIGCNVLDLNLWFLFIDGMLFPPVPPVLPPHELDPLHESDLIRAY